ncbi:hypothetical protein TGRUB_432810 [Toxoplasma gondii RUB]|uniref:Uncharacterized protein n=1 Tax=Toxoplasma gondii RUB TaxID=935652 RepID=A0A086LPR9_TOXGO|nr:hypothetical protein TGRUB_432810 [Toxoplasma gondii RUB]
MPTHTVLSNRIVFAQMVPTMHRETKQMLQSWTQECIATQRSSSDCLVARPRRGIRSVPSAETNSENATSKREGGRSERARHRGSEHRAGQGIRRREELRQREKNRGEERTKQARSCYYFAFLRLFLPAYNHLKSWENEDSSGPRVSLKTVSERNTPGTVT